MLRVLESVKFHCASIFIFMMLIAVNIVCRLYRDDSKPIYCDGDYIAVKDSKK